MQTQVSLAKEAVKIAREKFENVDKELKDWKRNEGWSETTAAPLSKSAFYVDLKQQLDYLQQSLVLEKQILVMEEEKELLLLRQGQGMEMSEVIIIGRNDDGFQHPPHILRTGPAASFSAPSSPARKKPITQDLEERIKIMDLSGSEIIFEDLVACLQIHSPMALSEITKLKSINYKRHGISQLREYIELAQKAGLVKIVTQETDGFRYLLS